MIILENKSPKVITLAVGEHLEFEPTFLYDVDYDDTTDATTIMYESKDPNIVSVGEFGYILANQVGESEIHYMVDNPAFEDGGVYIYSLKVNVIERSKEDATPEEDIELPKEDTEVVIPPIPECKPECKPKPIKVCKPCCELDDMTKRSISYVDGVFKALHTLMSSGTYTNEYGMLTNFSISYQLEAFDAIKKLITNKYVIDVGFVKRAINDFCANSSEHKSKLEKVYSYNASWDEFTKGIYSKYSNKDKVLFNRWLYSIITSTFTL